MGKDGSGTVDSYVPTTYCDNTKEADMKSFILKNNNYDKRENHRSVTVWVHKDKIEKIKKADINLSGSVRGFIDFIYNSLENAGDK